MDKMERGLHKYKIEEVDGRAMTVSTGDHVPYADQCILVDTEKHPEFSNPELVAPKWRVTQVEELGVGRYRLELTPITSDELGTAEQCDELVFRDLDRIAQEGA